MKKNRGIEQIDSKFQKPGIAVEEAWGNMVTLLNKSMPIAAGNNLIKKAIVIAIGKILPFVLAAFILSTIGYLGVRTFTADKKEAGEKKIENKKTKNKLLQGDEESSGNQNINPNLNASQTALVQQVTVSAIINKSLSLSKIQNTMRVASKENGTNDRIEKPSHQRHTKKPYQEKKADSLATNRTDTAVLADAKTNPLQKQLVAKKLIDKLKNKKSSGFQFGLEWNIYPGITNVEDNVDANIKRTQPYLWIIPAVWVRYSFLERHSLLLKMNPMAHFYKHAALPDSISASQSYFYKSLSLKVGLEYDYMMMDNLRAGIGLNLNKVYSATIYQRTAAADTTNTTVFRNNYREANKSNSYWSAIQDNTLEAGFSLSYQIKKIELGTNVYLPLNLKQGKIAPNTSMQIFMRWILF